MIKFQASISKGYLYQEAGFGFGEQYYLDPLYRREQDMRIHQWITERFPEVPIYNMEDNLVQAAFVDPDQVLVGGIQPNLILGHILGAGIRYFEDKDADLDSVPIKESDAMDDLPSPAGICHHPLIRLFDDQIETIRKKKPDLRPIPPFFWDTSGRATIHGIITTSLKLLGDRALMMAMTEPEQLKTMHQWITDCNIQLIDHYSALCDLSVRSIHVGECSGAMLSNDLYAEFVTPFVSQLGDHYSEVRLHSCGHSDHILQAISEIGHLKILDTASGTSVKTIRQVMGRNFEINVAPPVDLLLKGSTGEQVLAWLKTVLLENDGGPLKLAFHLDVGYAVEHCLSIYDYLVENDLITSGRLY
jgi:hypothetical protein